MLISFLDMKSEGGQFVLLFWDSDVTSVVLRQ